MPKLRNSWLQHIRQILDKTRFTSADFSIELLVPEENEFSLVFISFLANPDLSFEISQLPNGTLKVVTRPGQQYEEESVDLTTLADCFKRIQFWCTNVRDELGANLNLDQEIEEVRSNLQGQIDEHIQSTSSHFTQEEIDALRTGLAGMAEDLEGLKKRADESEELIEEMRRDISEMMDDLESYPKYVWLRTAGNKLLNIAVKASKSNEIRELMLKAAKGIMLGPGSGS